MTSFLSWLSLSSTATPPKTPSSAPNSSKMSESKPSADTSKTIVKMQDDDDWVFFEDLQNQKQTTMANTMAISTRPPQTAAAASAVDPRAALLVPTVKVDKASALESDLPSDEEVDDDDHFVENASVASTIEPVRVSLQHQPSLAQAPLSLKDTADLQPSSPRASSNSNLSAILSTSLSSLVQAAASVSQASPKLRDNLKSQPRNLQTLAQLKDKELKMKKMQKMASLRR